MFLHRALSLLKTLPPSTLDCPDVTKKILGDRPNTYTFTKVKTTLHRTIFFSANDFFEGNGRAASARRRCWLAHLYCQTKHRRLNMEGALWTADKRKQKDNWNKMKCRNIKTMKWKEPVPGWVDNLNGPTGLFLIAGIGVMRTAVILEEVLCTVLLYSMALPIWKKGNALPGICKFSWNLTHESRQHSCGHIYVPTSL